MVIPLLANQDLTPMLSDTGVHGHYIPSERKKHLCFRYAYLLKYAELLGFVLFYLLDLHLLWIVGVVTTRYALLCNLYKNKCRFCKRN